MRQLTQPRVLKMAVIAALGTTLACYPRFALWENRSAPLWYLEAMVFFCSIVLWGFVFAWHTLYTGCPVWILKPQTALSVSATACGVAVALMSHLFLDPAFRSVVPDEYPVDLKHWVATTLFSVFFNPLFVLFAPFAWLMRLSKNRRIATCLTVAFGIIVLLIRIRSSAALIGPPLFIALVVSRGVLGFVGVWLYLRGGIILIWWWTLLLQTRHLLSMTAHF